MKINDDKKAKEKIIDSAIELFYYQGFHGTTVRQIAQKAELNLALISYYFGGKKGLLEALMVQFYEGYFQAVEAAEATLGATEQESTKLHLIHTMKYTFQYLFDSYKMTRFIYRELTMDSVLIREVMTLYLSKEKYYYISILEEGLNKGQFEHDDLDIVVLQLLHILYMPFLQPQVIREVHYIEPLSQEFKERYFLQLEKWIRNTF